MIRKYILSFSILVILCNICICTKANNDVIMADAFVKTETVNRGECIKAVLSIIGVDEQSAQYYKEISSSFIRKPFSDIDSDNYTGYIVIAEFFNIAEGYEVLNGSTTNAFRAYNDATVKELLTFMLRCLKGSEYVDWNSIIEQADEIGLLSKSEDAGISSDEVVDKNTFRKLLEKFSDSLRYMYWDLSESTADYCIYTDGMHVDKSKNITYLEWNKQMQGRRPLYKTEVDGSTVLIGYQ